MPIRDFRPDDMPAYLQMLRELAAHTGDEADVTATEQALTEKFFDAEPKVFGRMLEVDGQPVGFTTWWTMFASWYAQHSMWLCELYVWPEHRRQGHATELMQDLMQVCRDRDFAGIGWWMDRTNDEAAAFYANLGAETSDKRALYRLML